MELLRAQAEKLPCWQGRVTLTPLDGGITNVNFIAEDEAGKYVLRMGDDIPEHGVMRFNELAASRAAASIGLSPEVVYALPGALLLRFVEGQTLSPEQVAERPMLERILPYLHQCHRQMPEALRGPGLMFWVFQVLRDYHHTLYEAESPWCPQLPELMQQAAALEVDVGAVQMVFSHNDLLAANWIDDGERLWLIDWDYAGFNSPLFDLGGLVSNNSVDADSEQWLLEAYFERPLSARDWQSYRAMKCASLLRETMWSMVSEQFSRIDFDFAAYTADNLGRYQKAWRDYQSQQGKTV